MKLSSKFVRATAFAALLSLAALTGQAIAASETKSNNQGGCTWGDNPGWTAVRSGMTDTVTISTSDAVNTGFNAELTYELGTGTGANFNPTTSWDGYLSAGNSTLGHDFTGQARN